MVHSTAIAPTYMGQKKSIKQDVWQSGTSARGSIMHTATELRAFCPVLLRFLTNIVLHLIPSNRRHGAKQIEEGREQNHKCRRSNNGKIRSIRFQSYQTPPAPSLPGGVSFSGCVEIKKNISLSLCAGSRSSGSIRSLFVRLSNGSFR